MKRIEVVAAVIERDGEFLATQRGYGAYKDWWEFPGGKIEAGETNAQALVREIHEELNADITVNEFLMTVEYDYPEFHLTMHCYLCSLANSHYVLLEHESARWLSPNEIKNMKWLPADLEVVNFLLDNYA